MLAQLVLAIAGKDFYKVLFDGMRTQLGACQLVVHRFSPAGPMIQPLAVEADAELAALDNTR